MLRNDPHRKLNQLRPMEIELGVLSRCHGSCRLRQGSTQVLVGVYAPHQLMRAVRERPNRTTVDLVWKPRSTVYITPSASGSGGGRAHLRSSGESDRTRSGYGWQYGEMKDRQVERILLDVLEVYIVTEMYPRSGVSLVVQALEEDGAVLGCALNACVMALMDAGVAMRGMPVALHCGIVLGGGGDGGGGGDDDDDGSKSASYVMIDPDAREESALCQSWGMFAFDLHKSNDTQCIVNYMGGRDGMTDDEYWSCLRAAKIGAKTMASFLRAAMQRKIVSTLPRSASAFSSKTLGSSSNIGNSDTLSTRNGGEIEATQDESEADSDAMQDE